MQKKFTPEIDIRASGGNSIRPETFHALLDQVSELKDVTIEAGYIAELALEQMVDNGLLDPKLDKDDTVYFPAHERDKLRFLCDDVGRRIRSLNEMAESVYALIKSTDPKYLIPTQGVCHERPEAQH